MRRLSLNARLSNEGFSSSAVEVVLLHIEHPQLDAPLRLSTDPTERLSIDPLAYGTRSIWMDSNPLLEPFQFIIASAVLPSDLEDAPADAQIVLDNLDRRIAEVLRSFTDRPKASLAVVLSSSPDLVEVEYRNLSMMEAQGDVGEISFSLSREPIEEEPYPKDRMTPDRFPGLFP